MADKGIISFNAIFFYQLGQWGDIDLPGVASVCRFEGHDCCAAPHSSSA